MSFFLNHLLPDQHVYLQPLIITLRFDLANMFLHFIDHWNLETPTVHSQQTTTEDISAYKVFKFRLVSVSKILIVTGELHKMVGVLPHSHLN